MRAGVITILLSALFLFSSPVFCEPDAKKPDILARIKPSLVSITAFDAKGTKLSSGSGFIIGEDGLVVTCWHTVAGASKVKVTRQNLAAWTAEGLVARDVAQDIAVLKVAARNLPVPATADSDAVTGGQKCLVVGLVSAQETSVDGTIGAVRTPPSAPKRFLLANAVSAGAVGGPITDTEGEIIAMASSIHTNGQDISFAIPVNAIKSVIPKSPKVTPITVPGSDVTVLAESLFLKGMLVLPEGGGKSLESRKKLEAALSLFQQALEKRQDYVEARFYAGYCFAQLERNEEAVGSYKQAIKTRPDYADAYFGLGLTYVAMDLAQDAAASFEEVVRINPDYADGWYNLALLYVQQGWAKEAIECFEQVIRVNPDYIEAYYNMGVSYVELGKNEEAVDSFMQALRIRPDLVQAHFGLGVAYSNMGRALEAADTFKQVIRLKPDYADAHFYLGMAYLKLDKRQEALDSFKQAVRINPEDADAHCQLGLVYNKLGKKEDATASFRQAVKVKPNNAEAHYNLGLIYLADGDRGGALDEYKALKDLDPDLAEKLFKAIYP